MTYTEIAAQRFLEGLPYRSPVAAIEAGARTIQEWCEVLAEARREHAGHLGGFIPQDYDSADDNFAVS
ncbi:MAG TPA: hypothetical protein VNT60_03235 [Deinococcales bacterium]|nr:hypothetical protein [Deinococcales bacterium]